MGASTVPAMGDGSTGTTARWRSHHGGHTWASTFLRWAPWLILAAGTLVGTASMATSGRLDPGLFLIFLVAIFVTLLLRVAQTATTAPSRRSSLTALAAGLVLWAMGSGTLAAAEAVAPTTFPAPGEWLFLASYAGFAGFVFLDAQVRSSQHSAAAWTDAAILWGASLALASVVLLTPLVTVYPDSGLGLLVAVLYPLIDVVLALVVVGQWARGRRPSTWRTASLAIGFILIAFADTSLMVSLGSAEYSFTLLMDVLWGLGFILIVDAACTPRTVVVARTRGQVPGWVMIVGLVTAIALLALRPDGLLGLAVAIPASIVVVGAGVRLLLDLRDAQSAADDLRLAITDDLTGLPNRKAIERRLIRCLASRQRTGVLLVDIDEFRKINDTLGHVAGDYLLTVVAHRIGEILPGSALLARAGGDVFAVIAATDDTVVLTEIARSARTLVSEPVVIDGLAVTVRASVGITTLRAADQSPVDIMRRADVALNNAQSLGSGVQVYEQGSDTFSRQRLQMADDLRQAIRAERIDVWYQPVVSAATGAVDRLEALARWDHPGEGMVPPAVFLPLAREEGLMLALSRQVAARAVADLASWRALGLDVSLSVNIAPQELLGGVLVPDILDLLRFAGVPTQTVTLEVTEDSFLTEPERSRQLLTEARRAGLRISIDNYGTGFSSLSYLRDLPVAEVKLDPAFIASMCSNSRSAVIVSSTVSMVHALEMSVVAAGIETSMIAARAVTMGVDGLQGYQLAAPMPAAGVPHLVRQLAISA